MPIDTLKLDANEGRPGRPPSTVAAFVDPESARRYPDTRPLEAALAAWMGLDPERVVVSNGGDDLIERYCRVLCRPGSVVLGTDPAFESYEASATRAGASYASVHRAPEGPFPAGALAAEAARTAPAFVVFASPDNPGGGAVSPAELREVAAAGRPLLFDATYSPFATDQAVYGEALSLAGCTTLGSFSKAWGLAGLRVGWAVTSPDVARAIRNAGPPYPVATTSLAAALAALGDGEGLRDRIVRTQMERRELEALLSSLGASCWPGEANFACARVSDAGLFAATLAERGVRVRTWPGRQGREDLVRITCPCDSGEFSRLAAALAAAKEYA